MAVVRVVSDIYVDDGQEDKLLKALGKESDVPPDFIAHTMLAEVQVKIRAYGSMSHRHTPDRGVGCSDCSALSGHIVCARQK